MSTEQLIQRLYNDVWTERRYEAASDIFHPEFISAAAPGLRGPEAKLAAIRMYHAAFPDLRAEIQEIVVTEDKAAARYTVSGTDEGGFRGRPPTGKRVVSWGVDFFGLSQGRIISNWVGADWLGTLVQLGVLPRSLDADGRLTPDWALEGAAVGDLLGTRGALPLHVRERAVPVRSGRRDRLFQALRCAWLDLSD